jgi:hypothetical protein
MKTKTKWPMIPRLVIKPRDMPEINIEATVLLTGKPVVDVRIGDDDTAYLFPAEARRFAAALTKAADCCDAKKVAARAIGIRTK